MSRTKKGSKGSGYEHWGRNQIGIERDKGTGWKYREPGRDDKTRQHRVDRHTTKQELKQKNDSIE